LVAMVVNKAMELQPERRYSSQRELLADLDAVEKRLLAGETGNELPSDSPDGRPKGPVMEGLSRTVMLIEANAGMQDLLREKLKAHGYRVLIVSDPTRGTSRFTGTQHVADVVIFSGLDLGAAALEAFNRFGN